MSAPQPPPFGYGAYDPPASKRGRPSVILLFRTYAAAGALAGGTLAVLAMMDQRSVGNDYLPFIVAGIAIAVVHAVGVAIPFKPWGWTYAFVLLALGLFSCLLPFAFGLLLYWKEPRTKAAFQRF